MPEAETESIDMLAIQTEEKQVNIILSAETTIISVEADTQIFRQALEEHGNKGNITIDANAVQEMDTAYLQLMRCFLKNARAMGINIVFCHMPESMVQLAKLYGLEWDVSTD